MANDQGIQIKKSEDISEWYQQLVLKSGLIDYSAVSGCYILKPSSYQIWEKLQQEFDKKIKKKGVKNCYFPLLIPESLLKKEQEHVEGFSPEVAWVTQAGDSKLDEKLAIRPTSETIMYDSYKKWIRSHRDLPLKLNQWNNVVRWEFKHPMPFLRSREFLWQEGHTAFATKEEATEEVFDILNEYALIYENLLAVPVIKGKKSEKEKFAGADFTTSIETILPNGKAIQAATSHYLGNNFAKAFDITFLDKQEKKQFVHQNSWGLSTRAIGIMVLIHSDDSGLVIPPNVAENKIVIIPIAAEKDEKVLKEAKKLESKLKKFNPILDNRDEYSAGWKFSEWELKGIPLRIELGPKDLEKKQAILVTRHDKKKTPVKLASIEKSVALSLETMQKQMYDKAKEMLNHSIKPANNKKELLEIIENKQLALMPWCNTIECEEKIKELTQGAKSINIPFEHQKNISGSCPICSQPANCKALFGKSY